MYLNMGMMIVNLLEIALVWYRIVCSVHMYVAMWYLKLTVPFYYLTVLCRALTYMKCTHVQCLFISGIPTLISALKV